MVDIFEIQDNTDIVVIDGTEYSKVPRSIRSIIRTAEENGIYSGLYVKEINGATYVSSKNIDLILELSKILDRKKLV